MLHRCKLWLRRTWNKLPVLLSFTGWPPLLSHGLAFILGTLLLRPAGLPRNPPPNKILIPLDRFIKIESHDQVHGKDQKFSLLQKQGATWCRLAIEPLAGWNPATKSGPGYLQWPAATSGINRLEWVLDKKNAVTIDPIKYAHCSTSRPAKNTARSTGVTYD